MIKLSLSDQNKFLAESKQTAIPLAHILESNGYTYDALIYQNSNSKYSDGTTPFVPVNERPSVANKIPCVSFFSGAGGLNIGFECAGFETLVDVEINEMFCDTLRMNGARNVIGPPFYKGDVSQYPEVISQLENLGIPHNFPGVFHGGPPCQSFSIAANQRYSKNGENFKRTGFQHEKYGNLLFCYINIIVHFRPEVFLIENVDGLLTIDNGEQVEKACSILKDAGYNVTPPRVVNAADYGVPQNRKRTLIIGSRIGSFRFPPPTKDKVPSGTVFTRPLIDAYNHVTRKHNSESVERYMKLEIGKRDKLGRVDRLDPRLPSKTIIAGGTGGGGRSHLHPYIPRTMSVRECARLQTFPDSYQFTGPVARQFTQVGNAVPPVLAYVMACAIYKSIYAVKENNPPKFSIVSFGQINQIKTAPVQLTLFESQCLYVVSKSPITLHGTYRKVNRQWIVDNNLYNYPVTEKELKEYKELTEVKRLILSRQKDVPLYFAVKGMSIITQTDLRGIGYITNKKHPAKTTYILYKLKQLKTPIPVYSKDDAYIVGKGINRKEKF